MKNIGMITALLLSLALVGCSGIQQSEKSPNSKEEKSEACNADNNDESSIENNTNEKDNLKEDGGKNKVDAHINEILETMTLHEKICQMFIVIPEVLTGVDKVTMAGEITEKKLEEYPVGGMIYMEYNLVSKEQTVEMISKTQKFAKKNHGIGMFISVDEEGGKVARCAESLGTTQFKPMYEYKEEGTPTAYQNAKKIGSDIKQFGFNLDYAPIADTWSNPENQIIGTRAYSDDFEETAELVEAAVKGYCDGGVLTTLKHFPGHGDTQTDSHVGIATSDKTIEQLEKEEYLAFERGIKAGADMVMMGHITMNSVDKLPATLSYEMVTNQLRNKLGFKKVIITDAMNMGAIANNYTVEEGTIKAIQAGNDIILMPMDIERAVKSVEDAVANGTITEERIEESVKRIFILKIQMGLLDME